MYPDLLTTWFLVGIRLVSAVAPETKTAVSWISRSQQSSSLSGTSIFFFSASYLSTPHIIAFFFSEM